MAVTGDRTVEANETLALKLSPRPPARRWCAPPHTGTITNDDTAVVVPTVSVSDASVTEGNSGTKVLVFNVTCRKPPPGGDLALCHGGRHRHRRLRLWGHLGTLTFAAGG